MASREYIEEWSVPMRVEHAEQKDVTSVMRIISDCILHMRVNGIMQWDEVYPDISGVRRDVEFHSLFVIRNEGACIASVALNDEQPDEYDNIPWRCNHGRALVAHRLCVHPEWQHRGLGNCLMGFAERFAANNDFSCVRLDAYTGNRRALALYERRDYKRAGQVFFPRRELPFACFEKELSRIRLDMDIARND